MGFLSVTDSDRILFMRTIYIPHNLSVGDITHISDRDSDVLINQERIALETPLVVKTPHTTFLARVVFIDKASIEVEIVQELGDNEQDLPSSSKSLEITILQAASNQTKYLYFLEKAVELGVSRIVPIHSELCLQDITRYQKQERLWRKVIADAIDQCRTDNPPKLSEIVPLRKIDLAPDSNEIRIALTTEPIDTNTLFDFINSKNKGCDFTIAVGPEKGWSSSDLETLKSNGFRFVNLKGNILRTETPAMLMISIIRYIRGDL